MNVSPLIMYSPKTIQQEPKKKKVHDGYNLIAPQAPTYKKSPPNYRNPLQVYSPFL